MVKSLFSLTTILFATLNFPELYRQTVANEDMINTLICIDRDGTLIYDTKEHLYLGRVDEWKAKVRILPGVIEGVKVLNSIPDCSVYMITNQPGVAITDFPLLSAERADEVCLYVIEEIGRLGGRIDGHFICPHADTVYRHDHPQYGFNHSLACECDCIKPGLGMVFDALVSEGAAREDVNVFVIGDRATDVQTALNIGGTGVLVPFENEPGEEEKLRTHPERSRIYIARDLLEAAEYFVRPLAGQPGRWFP